MRLDNLWVESLSFGGANWVWLHGREAKRVRYLLSLAVSGPSTIRAHLRYTPYLATSFGKNVILHTTKLTVF